MKNIAYAQFRNSIHSKSAKNKNLFRVIFELTYRCNFSCSHCYVPKSYRKKTGELETKQIFYILDQLKKQGCFYLGFTGGEPFMRKDIIEIIDYACKLGFQVIIYTNGSFLDKDRIKILSALPINNIDITVPAFNTKEFDLVVGKTGFRQKVFNAMKILKEYKVPFSIKTSFLKNNYNQLKLIKNYAKKMGINHRVSTLMFADFNGNKDVCKDNFFVEEKFYSQTIKESAKKKQAINTKGRKNIFSCGVGINQAAINPFGEIKMCLMIDYPNYSIKKDVKDKNGMLLNLAWKKIKKEISEIGKDGNYKCNDCELSGFCGWCPARAWLTNKNFTSCDKQLKVIAQRKKDIIESKL